jgi:hypothetical protein
MLVRLALKVVIKSDRDFITVTQLYLVSKFKQVNFFSAFLPKLLF